MQLESVVLIAPSAVSSMVVVCYVKRDLLRTKMAVLVIKVCDTVWSKVQ